MMPQKVEEGNEQEEGCAADGQKDQMCRLLINIYLLHYSQSIGGIATGGKPIVIGPLSTHCHRMPALSQCRGKNFISVGKTSSKKL